MRIAADSSDPAMAIRPRRSLGRAGRNEAISAVERRGPSDHDRYVLGILNDFQQEYRSIDIRRDIGQHACRTGAIADIFTFPEVKPVGQRTVRRAKTAIFSGVLVPGRIGE
jgi:hypothetical protein